MGIKSTLQKAGQQVNEVVQKVKKEVAPHINNVMAGKEYRAEECLKVFRNNNIKIVSKETGQEVTQWEDFGARIHRTGNYDLKFCKKEFAKQGFVPEDEYATTPLHTTFDTDKCFELFSDNNKGLYYKNTWFPVTQQSFDDGCKDSEPKAPFCDAFSSGGIFTGDYTLETCEAEFAKAEIFLLPDKIDL